MGVGGRCARVGVGGDVEGWVMGEGRGWRSVEKWDLVEGVKGRARRVVVTGEAEKWKIGRPNKSRDKALVC